jgi:hypothetical protein
MNMLDITGLVEKSIDELRSGLLDVPDAVTEVLERVLEDIREGKTNGRASAETFDGLSDYVNVIPSKRKGFCTRFLITLCYLKDDLEGRIFESLDHAVKQCPGKCEYIFFITTQWNSFTVDRLSGYLDSVRKNGVSIRMIYISSKGMVLMPD